MWVVLLIWILWGLPTANPPADPASAEQNFYLAIISLFYPVYYVVVSWAITISRWRRPAE